MADLLAIVAFWKAHKPNMPELAAKFRITKALASHLIRQYKRDPEMLAKRYCKEEMRNEKIALI